ncbi:MAG: rod shape-determining protein MreD, partial [Elusimicrobiota bacterium]
LFSLYLPVYGIVPALLLMSVLYFSLKYGNVFGGVYGFVCGTVLGLFSGRIFGMDCLALTIIGYFVGGMSHKLDESLVRVQVLMTMAASAFYYITTDIAAQMLLTGKVIFHPGLFAGYILYNTLISPFVFLLYNAWVNGFIKWSGKGKQI